ncbi:MAG: hypothetical protein WCI74_01880, partial [Actinomycetes bacterium]
PGLPFPDGGVALGGLAPADATLAHQPSPRDQRQPRRRLSVLTRNAFTALAVVLGITAIFLAPLIIGVVGLTAGVLGFLRRERHARLGLKTALVGMVTGLVWAYVAARFNLHL